MATKVKLSFSLSVLQSLSFGILELVYKELTETDAPPSANTPEKLIPEILKFAEPAPEPEALNAAKVDGLPEFTHQKKKYRVLMPKVEIPGIGERTAAELAIDAKAIDHLIKIGCVGTVIEEI